MHVARLIGAVYMAMGLFSHIKKHLAEKRGVSTKNITYREDGTVESIYKKSFFGYAFRLHYRKDSSLWKKEGYFWNNLMDDYTLYYPSGRVKYGIG